MNTNLTRTYSELGISRELLADRQLSECQEASFLVIAEIGINGKEHLLVPAAANAWRHVRAAALVDGVPLFIVSAFRSINRQTEIIRRKLEAGLSIEEIPTVCAPPGFSEHHTGCAVDVSTPGSPALQLTFEQTPAFAWLNAHAAKFNYYLTYPVCNRFGYQYEPWHWCFNEVNSSYSPDSRDKAPPAGSGSFRY